MRVFPGIVAGPSFVMITRINLIEREPFKFTYTRIIKSGVSIVIVCALVFGIQAYRISKYQRDLKIIEGDIARLKEERMRLLKAAPPKLEGGSQSFLNEVFTQTPKWSALISDVSKRLPGTVWFSSLTANTSFSGSQNSGKKQKKEEKATTQQQPHVQKKLIINGQTRSLDDLTLFISNITQSPFIQQTVLSNSKKEAMGFTFQLDCDMVAPNQ
ncbi:MAG TPA: hypothetical protein DDW49_11260 [Deltaproteobacteria bacterium]|nr:hypothetical protein [Deltaproteobacteria bacterium]